MFKKLFCLLVLPFYACTALEAVNCMSYCEPFCSSLQSKDSCFSSDQTFNCYGARFSVGPHFNYMHLDFDGPEAINGYMAGISAYSQIKIECINIYLDFEGSWDTNYLRGDPCQKSSVAEYFLELRVAPWNFAITDCLSAEVFTGFGWDQLTNTQLPGLASLQYRYNKYFIPVGFCLHSKFNMLDFGIQFEWRPDVNSRLNVDSTSLDNSCEDAYRIQIPINLHPFRCCGNLLFIVAPFFDWAKYGEAEDKNSLGVEIDIPSTTRWSLGLRTLIQMSF